MMPNEVDLERTVIERVDARLGVSLGGRYRLDYKIAAGGFGAVYHAFDTVARREVAVKVLHAALATDLTIVARFQREIHALAQLRDPHTVVAYDAGEAPDGSLYLVMELLAGESLFERFTSKGPLPWQTMVKIARGVCCSLAEAHALGIVHRDLKPANIHIEPRPNERDYVKVLDFGIAKLRDGGGVEDVTHVGQMVGTFDYMAPEQMAGNCVPQSDVFTLGIVIYEMISGARPFGNAPGPAAMLAALLGTTPKPLHGVPPLLAEIVARCLHRDPDERYANASELAAALAHLGERVEHEAPTVPARASSSLLDSAADAMLDGATVVDRRKPGAMPEAARNTLPGVIPQPPRPSLPRLAAGTVDPLPLPVPPTHPALPAFPAQIAQIGYAPPQQPAIPPTLPPHQLQQLRAPSPMWNQELEVRPRRVWPIALFIAVAVAVGIAIGIGFAG